MRAVGALGIVGMKSSISRWQCSRAITLGAILLLGCGVSLAACSTRIPYQGRSGYIVTDDGVKSTRLPLRASTYTTLSGMLRGYDVEMSLSASKTGKYRIRPYLTIWGVTPEFGEQLDEAVCEARLIPGHVDLNDEVEFNLPIDLGIPTWGPGSTDDEPNTYWSQWGKYEISDEKDGKKVWRRLKKLTLVVDLAFEDGSSAQIVSRFER